jgi:predicted membrane protein
MNSISWLIDNLSIYGARLYVYCTDFCINMANILDSSYYEFNFVLFCILFPLLTILLPIVYIVQCWYLKQLKKNKNEHKI